MPPPSAASVWQVHSTFSNVDPAGTVEENPRLDDGGGQTEKQSFCDRDKKIHNPTRKQNAEHRSE
jgi:hypothetical protein